jgi:hypothetical protein
LHVDTTTSANGTYKIFPESAEDVSEDQVNVTKELTEAPNQSSEDIDISDFSPTSKDNAFEDSTLPLSWSCALPEGWSVEWDPSPANTDDTE